MRINRDADPGQLRPKPDVTTCNKHVLSVTTSSTHANEAIASRGRRLSDKRQTEVDMQIPESGSWAGKQIGNLCHQTRLCACALCHNCQQLTLLDPVARRTPMSAITQPFRLHDHDTSCQCVLCGRFFVSVLLGMPSENFERTPCVAG